MKLALAIVAFCALVVVAVAQHPRHCVAPAEFEAHAVQWDMKMKFGRQGRLAYDSRMERTALYEEVRNGTDDEYYHTIHLHREHKTFRYNLKSKTCTVENLNYPFRRIEIPHNAHFVGDAIIGTNAFASSGVLTTHWHHKNDSPKFEWYGVFTDRSVGCVPVMDHFHDDNIGTMETRFFDVVLGIGDPDIFIPPHECNQN